LLLLTSANGFNGGENVKDAIVSTLSSQWPLSLKEIYFAVARRHSLSVSQQAVHKSLKQVVEARVLTKNERRYSLNIEWIREVKTFGASLEKAYLPLEIREEMPTKQTKIAGNLPQKIIC